MSSTDGTGRTEPNIPASMSRVPTRRPSRS